jgi:hypothetical protein
MSRARRFMTKWPRALVGAMAGVFAARAAFAQTEAIRLEYRADEGCPGAAWFFAQVEERTARVRLASGNERGRTFVITLVRGRSGATGKLAIQEAQRVTVAREVTGEQCRDVAAALALATALAIDPLAALAPAGDSGPGASASEPPRDSADTRSDAARAAPPVAPSNPAALPDPTAAKDRARGEDGRSAPWTWGTGAGVVLAHGPAPGLSIGGAAFVERETQAPAMVSALRVSALALQAPEHAVSSALASFRFFFLRPELCSVRLRVGAALSVVPCVALDLGLVSASGSNIDTPLGDERFWAAALALGRLRYAISRALFLQADVSLAFPLTRHSFYFRDPDTLIHTVPPFVAMGGAGVGISFP